MSPHDASAVLDAHPAALGATRCAPTLPLTTTDTTHQPTRRSIAVEEKENHHGLIS